MNYTNSRNPPRPAHLDVSAHYASAHLGGVDAQGRGRQPQHDGRHLLPVAEELRDPLPEGLAGELEAGQDRLPGVRGLLALLRNPGPRKEMTGAHGRGRA